MNITKRGIDIIPKKKRKKIYHNLFPYNYNFFHANSYSDERKRSCLRNNLIHIGCGIIDGDMTQKRKGNGSTSHQAELFIKHANKNKTIIFLFENGSGKTGQYTHYGIFNGIIESTDNDIYPQVTNKQPGIWKDEFQYAIYVHKWIPITNNQKINIYNKINPTGKSRRKTLQKINLI